MKFRCREGLPKSLIIKRSVASSGLGLVAGENRRLWMQLQIACIEFCDLAQSVPIMDVDFVRAESNQAAFAQTPQALIHMY